MMRRFSILLMIAAAAAISQRPVASAEKETGMPAQAVRALDTLVGSWKAEGTLAGEKQTGRFTCRWAQTKDQQKVCLIGRFSYKIGDEVRSGVTLIGWNAARKCIEDRGFDGLGGNAVLLWTIKSPTLWQGDVTIVEDGETINAKADLVRNGPSEIVYEAEMDNGDTARVVFRKVKKDQKTSKQARGDAAAGLVELLAEAAVHTLNEEFAEAERCYRKVLSTHGRDLSAKNQLKVAFLLARAMVAQGPRHDETASLLENVLEQHRGTVNADDPDVQRAANLRRDHVGWFVWNTCVNPESDKRSYARAVQFAHEAIKLNEEDAPIPIWALALAQLRSGDKEASLETMKRALAVEPVEPGRFMWLVMALIEKADGNDDIARALHVAASRWLAKTRTSWEPALNMQQQTAAATGLSATYPPAGWKESDCLAAIEKLLAKYPDFPRLRGYRAAMLASQKKWKEALAEYSRAAEMNPDNFRHLEELTALELYTNRDPQKRTAACQRLIDKFLDHENPYTAGDTVVMCSLAADAELDRARLLDAVNAATAHEAAQDNLPFFHMARGMALYRCGKYREALDTIPEVNWEEGAFNQVYVPLYRAMASHHLGDQESAKRFLAKGRDVIASQLPTPDGPLSRWRDRATDWCMAQMALQEAETLIGQ